MENSRKVLAISTSRGTVEIPTEAKTWEQLKSDLTRNNVTYSGMKAVIGSTKQTLEHPDAALPEGDFELFLMPFKSKSGAGDRKATYATIKDLVTKDGDKAKEHFNSGGENYTRKKTEELDRLIESYTGAPTPAAASVAEEVTAKKAKTTTAVAEKAAVQVVIGISQETKDSIMELAREIKTELDESVDDEDEEVNSDYDELSETRTKFIELYAILEGLPVTGTQVSAPATPVRTVGESAEDKKAREEKEAKEEKERQDRSRDLAKGFSDVKSW